MLLNTNYCYSLERVYNLLFTKTTNKTLCELEYSMDSLCV